MAIKEWSEKNELNSFNSFAKGLTFYEHYKAIDEWRQGIRNAPLPPIEISLDPIHACNLHCNFCNASRYLEKGLEGKRMPDEHLINLIKFLGKWGANAICFGGGGSPLLHTKMKDALYTCQEVGMEASIATNGTLFTDELIKAMAETCKWVGVSVDAGTRQTYQKERNADKFVRTITNLAKLADYCKNTRSKCDVSYKFLIFKNNQHEIYKAAQLAKSLGVKTFHARPASYAHQGMKNKIENPYDMNLIEEQFKKCRELEDENFNVYLVVHKFNTDFSTKREFKQCWTGPICIQLCADGGIYNCPDSRHLEDFKLGEHTDPENIRKVWGSQKHYDLVFDKACKICDWRCTFGYYNKMFEKLFIDKEDPLCRNFV